MYIMSLNVSKALMRVWTKRGGDRGLPYSLTRLSIAVNNVLHHCVIRLSSVLLAANFLNRLVVDPNQRNQNAVLTQLLGSFRTKEKFL